MAEDRVSEANPADAPVCGRCELALVPGPVTLTYLGHNFTVDLPRCPGCGQVYISPDLALGRMTEVEMMLEDK